MLQLLLLYIILVSNLFLSPQTDWQLVKNKNGIKVYTATSNTPSGERIKAEAMLEGTPTKLLSVFRNIPDQKQWVYGTKQSYTIKSYTENDMLYYVETALPWPVSNRDIAIWMTIAEHHENHTIQITMAGEPVFPITGYPYSIYLMSIREVVFLPGSFIYLPPMAPAKPY